MKGQAYFVVIVGDSSDLVHIYQPVAQYESDDLVFLFCLITRLQCFHQWSIAIFILGINHGTALNPGIVEYQTKQSTIKRTLTKSM